MRQLVRHLLVKKRQIADACWSWTNNNCVLTSGTNNTSYNVFLCKDVPTGVTLTILPIPGVKLPTNSRKGDDWAARVAGRWWSWWQCSWSWSRSRRRDGTSRRWARAAAADRSPSPTARTPRSSCRRRASTWARTGRRPCSDSRASPARHAACTSSRPAASRSSSSCSTWNEGIAAHRPPLSATCPLPETTPTVYQRCQWQMTHAHLTVFLPGQGG